MIEGTLVYDDDCGFCKWWVDYFARRSEVETVGFSELTDEQRARLPENYEECAHFLTNEEVYSCGAAIEEAAAVADVPPGSRDIVGFFRQFEDYERLRENVYAAVAERRGTLGQFISKEKVGE
jgi:predicted DCC family thiol-disulfide oxidoreductase YuxK